MPILTGDIKLVASQVMDDVPEGGTVSFGIDMPPDFMLVGRALMTRRSKSWTTQPPRSQFCCF